MEVHRSLVVVVLLVVQYIGLVLFLKGFFPIKQAIPGSASLSSFPPEPGSDAPGSPVDAVLDRLVIVLIDALRADFVLPGDGRMKYLNELVRNNESLSFLAKAHPPTVTMPRIKALMTGGIPGFIDVLLNSLSTELQEDNLLAQLTAAGKKIVFFGDDTWIKLFPGNFMRSDGTNSFFVSDYTEVDDNVTRHLGKELSSKDWDVMILHYLGLDHIGHLAGPSSPLIGPKLQEMDDILRDIHRNLIHWDQEMGTHSAIVLCGDHGMSDSGSHGGASLPETLTPLVFLSSRLKDGRGAHYSREEIEQIDLVPSLATLLGAAIPQNSIGLIIPQLMTFHGPREKLRSFQLNADQLLKVLIANGHSPSDLWELDQATRLHQEWLHELDLGSKLDASMTISAEQIIKQYSVALKKMSDAVSGSLSCYDLHAMAVAVMALVQMFFWFLYSMKLPAKQGLPGGRSKFPNVGISGFAVGFVCLVLVTGHLTVCSSASKPGTCSSNILCSFTFPAIFFSSVIIIVSTISMSTLISIILSINKTMLVGTFNNVSQIMAASPRGALLVVGTILHVFSLLSSSFVEEEHQTWYFLVISYFLLDFCCTVKAAFGYKKNATTKDHRMLGTNNVASNDYTTGAIPYGLRSLQREQRAEVHHYQQPWSTSHEGTLGMTYYCVFKECGSSMWTSVLLVFTIRISRTLNQTGIKWASQPDVSDWLVAPDNKLIFSVISFTSILIILASQVQRSRLIESFILAIGLTLVYHYRSATGSLTSPWQHHEVITDGLMEARLVYCCSLALVICSILTVCKTLFKAQGEDDSTPFSAYQKTLARALDTFLMGLLVLEALLLRTHNVVLLALFVMQENRLANSTCNSNNPTWRLALLYYWLGQATYFALGNSNSLSTVDIAAGYIGMRAHDGLVALILMSLATYASPVLWLTALIKYQVKNATSYTTLQDSMYRACVTMVVPNALLLCVYCTLVYAQRYHLFVWSVFSPKLLYETMRALVMFCAYATVLIFASVIDKHGKISQSKKQ